MAQTIKIDKQGRIVIPANIRRQLSITEDTLLEISLIANQVIIRKKTGEDKETISQWKQKIENMSIEAFKEDIDEEKTKWYSEEYVRNKLGL
ncbi:MAG: AbrB/MazE/SpoVT family DNA-binding domain-containing protein [Candidatus Hermodarchaeota archaeon]